jgi:hypothetical protein
LEIISSSSLSRTLESFTEGESNSQEDKKCTSSALTEEYAQPGLFQMVVRRRNNNCQEGLSLYQKVESAESVNCPKCHHLEAKFDSLRNDFLGLQEFVTKQQAILVTLQDSFSNLQHKFSRKNVSDEIKSICKIYLHTSNQTRNRDSLVGTINDIHQPCRFTPSERNNMLNTFYHKVRKSMSITTQCVNTSSKEKYDVVVGKPIKDAVTQAHGISIKLSDFHLSMAASTNPNKLIHQIAEITSTTLTDYLGIDSTVEAKLVEVYTQLSDLATLVSEDHEVATQSLTTIFCIVVFNSIQQFEVESSVDNKFVYSGNSTKLRAYFPQDPEACLYAQTKDHFLEAIGFTDIIIRNLQFVLFFVENKLAFGSLQGNGKAIKEKSQLCGQLISLLQREDHKAETAVGILTDGITAILMAVSRTNQDDPSRIQDEWELISTPRTSDPKAVVALFCLAFQGPKKVKEYLKSLNNKSHEPIPKSSSWIALLPEEFALNVTDPEDIETEGDTLISNKKTAESSNRKRAASDEPSILKKSHNDDHDHDSGDERHSKKPTLRSRNDQSSVNYSSVSQPLKSSPQKGSASDRCTARSHHVSFNGQCMQAPPKISKLPLHKDNDENLHPNILTVHPTMEHTKTLTVSTRPKDRSQYHPAVAFSDNKKRLNDLLKTFGLSDCMYWNDECTLFVQFPR